MKIKLAQLAEQLEQLDKLKKEYEAKAFREKDLMAKLKRANQRPPIVFIGSPKAGLKVEYKNINLYGVVEDDKAIEKIEFYINGEINERISKRGLFVPHNEKSKRIEFNGKIAHRNG